MGLIDQNKQRLQYIVFLLLFFITSCTSQRGRTGAFFSSFERVLDRILDYLSLPQVQFIIVLICAFVFFFTIIEYAFSFAGFLSDGGKTRREGRILAGVISIMAIMPLLFALRGKSVEQLLGEILGGVMGFFFCAILGVVFFTVTYLAARHSWGKIASTSAGLVMGGLVCWIFAGILRNFDAMRLADIALAVAILLLIGKFIWWLLSGLTWKGLIPTRTLRNGSIEGSVFFSSGRGREIPVRNAKVKILGRDRDVKETDDSGRFTFENLPPTRTGEPYTVCVWSDHNTSVEIEPKSQQRKVRSGKREIMRIPVRLRDRRRRVVEGEVLDKENNPVEGAIVKLGDLDATQGSHGTGKDGKYSFVVPPDMVNKDEDLQVIKAPGLLPYREELHVPDQDVKKDIHVEKDNTHGEIKGVVHKAGDQDVRVGTRIEWLDGRGNTIVSCQSDPHNGTFKLAGVPIRASGKLVARACEGYKEWEKEMSLLEDQKEIIQMEIDPVAVGGVIKGIAQYYDRDEKKYMLLDRSSGVNIRFFEDDKKKPIAKVKGEVINKSTGEFIIKDVPLDTKGFVKIRFKKGGQWYEGWHDHKGGNPEKQPIELTADKIEFPDARVTIIPLNLFIDSPNDVEWNVNLDDPDKEAPDATPFALKMNTDEKEEVEWRVWHAAPSKDRTFDATFRFEITDGERLVRRGNKKVWEDSISNTMKQRAKKQFGKDINNMTELAQIFIAEIIELRQKFATRGRSEKLYAPGDGYDKLKTGFADRLITPGGEVKEGVVKLNPSWGTFVKALFDDRRAADALGKVHGSALRCKLWMVVEVDPKHLENASKEGSPVQFKRRALKLQTVVAEELEGLDE